jgi:catechol 2,3-dioxygenase-like lactoylglutathione lyase family enzyme
MISVRSVVRSIAFYRKLGFEVGKISIPSVAAEPSWAWLQSGEASLMVALASHPVDGSQQAVILCLYRDDISGFRKALLQAGLAVGEIDYPQYNPRGRFRLADPDGFYISVAER